MVWIPLVLCVLLAVFFTFAGKGLQESRMLSNPDSILKDSSVNGTLWLIWSVVASSLTVTGGLVASISGALLYGPYFFFAPVSAVLAILLFTRFYGKSKEGKFVSSFPRISKDRSFEIFFFFATVIVQTFVVGWEIFIVTQIYAQIYSNISVISNNSFLITILLSISCGLYIYRGGWEKAAKTDVYQGIAVVLFVIIMLVWASRGDTPIFSSSIHNIVPHESLSLVSIAFFCLAVVLINIPYAIIEPNNWQIAASAGKQYRPVMYWGSLILMLFFCCVYILASMLKISSPFAIFEESPIGLILACFLPIFLWSTVDTRSIAVTRMFDSALLKKKITITSDNTLVLLKVIPVIFIIFAASVSFVLNLALPNIFIAFLSSVGSMIVFVPGFILNTNQKCIHESSQKYLAYCYGIIFLITFFSGFLMALFHLNDYVFFAPILGFVTMFLLEYFWHKKDE